MIYENMIYLVHLVNFCVIKNINACYKTSSQKYANIKKSYARIENI